MYSILYMAKNDDQPKIRMVAYSENDIKASFHFKKCLSSIGFTHEEIISIVQHNYVDLWYSKNNQGYMMTELTDEQFVQLKNNKQYIINLDKI